MTFCYGLASAIISCTLTSSSQELFGQSSQKFLWHFCVRAWYIYKLYNENAIFLCKSLLLGMGYTNQVYSSNEIMTKEGSSKIVNFITALFKCVLCLGTAVYVSNLGHKLLVIDMINRVDYLIYLYFLYSIACISD